MNQLTD